MKTIGNIMGTRWWEHPNPKKYLQTAPLPPKGKKIGPY
jgi:hypothetical protein